MKIGNIGAINNHGVMILEGTVNGDVTVTSAGVRRSPDSHPPEEGAPACAMAIATQMSPIRIFVIYAPQDEDLYQELRLHLVPLRRAGLIDLTAALGGDVVSDQLKGKDILLVLVSSSLLGSDDAYAHVEAAMKLHQAGTRVVPVLLRPTSFRGLPIEPLVPLPRGGRSVTEWTQRDSAWSEIAHELRSLAETLRQANPLREP